MKKRIAFCLAFLLTIQSFVVAVSAQDPEQASGSKGVYTGSILAAINTNYDTLMQDFAAEPVGGKQEAAAASAYAQAEPTDKPIDAPQMEDPEPLSAAEAKAKEAALGKYAQEAAPKADYRVGDRRNVYSSYRTESESNRVDLECIYTNELCTVWVEDCLMNRAETYIKEAEKFCEILPREWELFGDRRIDPDGDGKIALFYQKMDSGYGGYFSSSDLVDKYGRIGSVWVAYKGTGNFCDCVHLYPYADYDTVLHEYQHYLHCSWKYAGKNNLTCVNNSHESYINEGFSGCAEALLGNYNRVNGMRYAAEDPSAYSLVNWCFDSASYSMSYVFCQYLRARYALLTNDLDSPIPGSGLFRTILKTRSEKHVRNTLSIAADLLYPKEQYPALKTSDSRCRELIKDFWLAALRKDASGIHGFNGETWANNLYVPVRDELPAAGSPVLGSGMALFCRVPAGGSAHVTRAGSQMRFVGMEGVEKTIVLDWRDARYPTETVYTTGSSFKPGYREVLSPGRSFLGWTTDPDGETALYNYADSVPLSDENPTVLYGVWEDAQTLTTDAGVICKPYAVSCARFTPDTDGYYVFRSTGGRLLGAEADGESLDVQWKESTTRVCYRLSAGKTIDLFINTYGARVTLRVQRPERQFTLRYSCALRGETIAKEIGGNTQYTLAEPDEDVLLRAMRQDLVFLGWSDTPDAQTVSHSPYSTVTLKQNTTLYAVWYSIPALQDGSQSILPILVPDYNPFSDCYFTFTPPADGTYRFSGVPTGAEQFSGGLTAYDADQNCLQAVHLYSPDDGGVCDLTLRAGRKYRFMYSVDFSSVEGDGTCAIRIGKVSGKPSARIIYSVPKSTGTLFDGKDLVLKPRFSNTVPDWLLGQNDLKKTDRLVGWSTDPDDEDAEVYRPGDTLEPIADVTLYAVTEPVAQTRLKISVAAFVLRNVRMFFRYLRILAADRLR